MSLLPLLTGLRLIGIPMLVVALVLGFVLRQMVVHTGGSVWEELRHLFDIEVPQLHEPASHDMHRAPLPPVKRRSCPRCGSALPLGATSCDTCARLGIPPLPQEPAWTPPREVAPVDFVSYATWTTARPMPDPILGPAVLRVKVAMAAMLAAAFVDFALSGLSMPGWFRVYLLVAAGLLLVLLLVVRRASVIGLACALALVVGALASELIQTDVQTQLGSIFGPVALLVGGLEAAAIAQAIPAAGRLRASRNP